VPVRGLFAASSFSCSCTLQEMREGRRLSIVPRGDVSSTSTGFVLAQPIVTGVGCGERETGQAGSLVRRTGSLNYSKKMHGVNVGTTMHGEQIVP
jgi:hypothetical protein